MSAIDTVATAASIARQTKIYQNIPNGFLHCGSAWSFRSDCRSVFQTSCIDVGGDCVTRFCPSPSPATTQSHLMPWHENTDASLRHNCFVQVRRKKTKMP